MLEHGDKTKQKVCNLVLNSKRSERQQKEAERGQNKSINLPTNKENLEEEIYIERTKGAVI